MGSGQYTLHNSDGRRLNTASGRLSFVTTHYRPPTTTHDSRGAACTGCVIFPPVSTPLLIFDGLGWIGALCVLIPYALVSVGRLLGTAPLFRNLNIIGAVFLMLNTWYHRAYPSTIVNVVWILIGIYAAARGAPRSDATTKATDTVERTRRPSR